MAEKEKTEAAEVPILSRLRPPAGAVRNKMRVGRGVGSGKGKTSGKGQKGQTARHPRAFGKLHFEGGQMPLQRRFPKVGFWNPFRKSVATVNVRDLARFDKGATVGIDELRQKGLVKGRHDVIKVLGEGEIDRALTVRANAFSASAKEKIEKAGGKVEVIEITAPPKAGGAGGSE